MNDEYRKIDFSEIARQTSCRDTVRIRLRPAAALAALLVASTGLALAQQMSADINRISASGVGEKIGTVTATEGKDGVSFKVSVKALPAAQRGFHVQLVVSLMRWLLRTPPLSSMVRVLGIASGRRTAPGRP